MAVAACGVCVCVCVWHGLAWHWMYVDGWINQDPGRWGRLWIDVWVWLWGLALKPIRHPGSLPLVSRSSVAPASHWGWCCGARTMLGSWLAEGGARNFHTHRVASVTLAARARWLGRSLLLPLCVRVCVCVCVVVCYGWEEVFNGSMSCGCGPRSVDRCALIDRSIEWDRSIYIYMYIYQAVLLACLVPGASCW
jgi:hypothetical protein